MDTPLEESNLAHIGSDKDKALRQAAAAIEMNWEGAGQSVGLQIWRVENKRDDNDNPVFGIKEWPKKHYGELYRGDSYIVLQTTKDGDALMWDIYFWIGSESSQDEYGVAAYKANELDDLLGDAPVQHREIEGNESTEFMECFPKGVRYMEGGIDSGFRHVDAEAAPWSVPTRLFQVHREGPTTRSFQVPVDHKSLNQGDAFLLDTGTKIFTWFGSDCSPFEKSKTGELAHNLAENRYGHCQVLYDVGDDNEEFWELLGGKGEIKSASAFTDKELPEHETNMYVVSDAGGKISIEKVEATKSNLVSGDVCLIDAGSKVFVWVGKGSSNREKQMSMQLVEKELKAMGRTNNTSVCRVLEGQERRCRGFGSAF